MQGSCIVLDAGGALNTKRKTPARQQAQHLTGHGPIQRWVITLLVLPCFAFAKGRGWLRRHALRGFQRGALQRLLPWRSPTAALCASNFTPRASRGRLC